MPKTEFCEFCPADGGPCGVCDTGGRPARVTTATTDPYLLIADAGRESGEAGGDWRDNPYIPGTRAYFEFGGAQHDAKS